MKDGLTFYMFLTVGIVVSIIYLNWLLIIPFFVLGSVFNEQKISHMIYTSIMFYVIYLYVNHLI